MYYADSIPHNTLIGGMHDTLGSGSSQLFCGGHLSTRAKIKGNNIAGESSRFRTRQTCHMTSLTCHVTSSSRYAWWFNCLYEQLNRSFCPVDSSNIFTPLREWLVLIGQKRWEWKASDIPLRESVTQRYPTTISPAGSMLRLGGAENIAAATRRYAVRPALALTAVGLNLRE